MQDQIRATVIWLTAIMVVASTTPLRAQEEAPQPDSAVAAFAEAVNVRVVNVEVNVTDKAGVPVSGLSADDFELKVDGEPTQITNFYAESAGRAREVAVPTLVEESTFRDVEEVAAEPRGAHVVVVVDNSRLHAASRKRAFNALRPAIDRLAPQDKVAVVSVDGGLVFHSDFLYDRQAIHRIFDDLQEVSVAGDLNEIERRQIFNELARGMSGGIQARASLADEQMLISRIQAYAVQEYERSVRSMRTIERVISTMTGLPGRKALMYVGEGIPTRPGEGLYVEWRNRFGGGNPQANIGLRRFDFDTDYTRSVGRFDLTQAMQALANYANRAEVALYAIDAEDAHGGLVRAAMTEQGATSETISVVDENYREPLEYSAKATGGRWLQASGLLEERLTAVVQDLGIYYSLGFAPGPDWKAGENYNIEVAVRRKGLQVRHRESVAVPTADEREAAAVVAALLYQAVDNPLGVKARPETPQTRDDGSVALPIQLQIPVGSLGLIPAEGFHQGSVSIYVSTRAADGNARPVQRIPFDLNIPADKLEVALTDLAHYPLPVVLRPGDRQVAIGVSDRVTGALSTLRLDVSEYAPKS